MYLRKARAGGTSHGLTWAYDEQILEVPLDVATDLLSIRDAGFSVVEADRLPSGWGGDAPCADAAPPETAPEPEPGPDEVEEPEPEADDQVAEPAPETPADVDEAPKPRRGRPPKSKE